MRRVFVFEYLTGGGLVEGAADAVTTLLPLGLRMRDAMVGDLLDAGNVRVTVATCASAPPPLPGASACRPLGDESLFDLVTRQAALHDAVWLVAPETDDLLARFQACVPAARWLGCAPAAVRLASSKRATLARLAAAGVATPLDFTTTATRWVVKPDDGAGAVATRVHPGHRAALQAQAAAGGDRMTIEPWVEGAPMSISLLCRGGAAELLCVNRQRIEIDPDGRLAYCGVDFDSQPGQAAAAEVTSSLSALAARVASAIAGLHGFVGIDLVWHALRGPVVIEVNPRVTCAYVGLSARLGRNLAAEMLAWQEPVHARA